MRAGTIVSPSRGWAAGSGPARSRISGRALWKPGARWRRTKTLAGRPGRNAATTVRRASTPPAEAPITKRSRGVMSPPVRGPLPLLSQHLADLFQELPGRERLLQEVLVRGQHAVVG